MTKKYEHKKIPQGPGPKLGEKPKDFKSSIKKLVIYTKKYRVPMIIAMIFAMLGSILTLVGPNLLSNITDIITEHFNDLLLDLDAKMNIEKIFTIGTVLIFIYIGSFIVSSLQGLIMNNSIQKVSKELRGDLSSKIDKLPMGYFFKNTKGDVLSRVTNDVDTIAQTLGQSVGTLISAVTLLLGCILMMFITNWILAITAILSVIFGFVFMMIIMKKGQEYFQNQQKHLGEINGHIEEIYTGHLVVRAYNAEDNSIEVFNDTNNKLKQSAFKAQALSGLMMPMMTFIGNFGYIMVCVIGALLTLNDLASMGTIVAFMIYIRLFTQPLGQIAQSMQQMQTASAASERVFEFLEEDEMSDESHKKLVLDNINGNIEFKNVRFGYLENQVIIKDFSTKVKEGQKIAIVGPTGAGKTTIINLLMRFYDINSGDILIDGTSIFDVPRSQVQKNFSMVLQDTWIFEGTLRENLVYSTPNISDESIDQACKAVGLLHFAKTLEHGYDTVLNDSVELSIGQKQQITIARAMIANKPMLILDEATSSIDTRTELIIQKAMDELMENRTSFVIAHRLSTIKNADVILVLKDGDIIETGNHESLLKQNGFYAELYNSQFEQK